MGAILSTVYDLPTGCLKIQRLKYTGLQLFVLYMTVTVTSLILQEEHKLRVFQNKVLRNIFRPKSEAVIGECSKLHNEYHYMHSSPYQGRVGLRM
jgi:hypothetical protein